MQLQLAEQSRKITAQEELIAELSASKTAPSQKAEGERTNHHASISVIPQTVAQKLVKESSEDEKILIYTVPARRRNRFSEPNNSQGRADDGSFSQNENPRPKSL